MLGAAAPALEGVWAPGGRPRPLTFSSSCQFLVQGPPEGRGLEGGRISVAEPRLVPRLRGPGCLFSPASSCTLGSLLGSWPQGIEGGGSAPAVLCVARSPS